MIDTQRFISALTAHVAEVIRREGNDVEYCTEAVQILDAHNILLKSLTHHHTDEQEGIYTIRELSRLRDDGSFLYQPDVQRITRIAQHYF